MFSLSVFSFNTRLVFFYCWRAPFFFLLLFLFFFISFFSLLSLFPIFVLLFLLIFIFFCFWFPLRPLFPLPFHSSLFLFCNFLQCFYIVFLHFMSHKMSHIYFLFISFIVFMIFLFLPFLWFFYFFSVSYYTMFFFCLFSFFFIYFPLFPYSILCISLSFLIVYLCFYCFSSYFPSISSLCLAWFFRRFSLLILSFPIWFLNNSNPIVNKQSTKFILSRVPHSIIAHHFTVLLLNHPLKLVFPFAHLSWPILPLFIFFHSRIVLPSILFWSRYPFISLQREKRTLP